MKLFLLICVFCGVIRGRRILRETHAGKLPGVSASPKDRDVWVFLEG